MAVKYNYKNGKKISGTSSADSITNYADNVIINAGKGNDFILNWGNNSFIDGGSGNDSIRNIRENSTIIGGAGDDSIFTEYTTTITAGKGNDTVRFNTSGYEDDALTYNYATGDGNDVIEIENGFLGKGKNEILINLTSGTLGDTVKLSDGSIHLKIGSGSILLKYLNKESVKVKEASGTMHVIKEGSGAHAFINRTDDILLRLDNEENEIRNDGKNVTIIGGTGADFIDNDTDKVTIDGGNNNDIVENSSENVSINGGAGNDTIYNTDQLWWNKGGKYVTIAGGAGDDYIGNNEGENLLIKYSSGDGNDLIVGFNETSSLQIGNGTGTYSTKTSGSDIIVTVGKGKITLEGAASLEKVNINSDIILTNASKSSVTIGSAIKNVNASKQTKAVKVTGNALANTITGGSKNDTLYGGKGNDSILGNAGNDKLYGQAGNDILKGGAGNDSLWGGAGNDSLWGGSGADVFLYSSGEGKDVIYGFANNDMLKITGAFSASYSKSKDEVYFKVGTTSKAITLTDFSASSFNVNGDLYQISGTKLVKK